MEVVDVGLNAIFVLTFQTVSEEILAADVEIFGDLMLDVAEAFMAQQVPTLYNSSFVNNTMDK
jgi:hypothetical protein